MTARIARLRGRAAPLVLAASVTLAGAAALFLPQRRAPEVPPLSPPDQALQVFHLGHSLVGADIPHILQQLAGDGHRYHTQRGSGTSLRAHWEEDVPILDFESANPAPVWRDARGAIAAGDYDAVILTEMVELRDALRYFEGAAYLHRWAQLARAGNPAVRLYLYETWHRLDDPQGWLTRIDRDLEALWLDRLLARDDRRARGGPVYLIPGGQVLAAATRAAEAGQLPGIASRDALFAQSPEGNLDPIHLSPLGSYLIALTHYAVLYHRSPEGLPHAVTLADGAPFALASEKTAAALQHLVWQVVTALPRTGLVPTGLAPTDQAATRKTEGK